MFFDTSDFFINNISVYHLSWKKSNAFTKNDRPFNALSYRIKGNATFTHQNKQTIVKSGDIIFTPANCKYHINAEDEELIVIHFNSNVELSKEIIKITLTHANTLKNYFLSIYDLYTKKSIGYEYECKSIIYKIFSIIDNELNAQQLNEKDIIEKATNYINENLFSAETNVEYLSRLYSVSQVYFRKLFKKRHGKSVLEYINLLKLDYALELLSSNYYTVSEVSEKCGFLSPYYFSYFIKKHTGNPPSYYITK
jgi:AraC-like DNA-binding protein